ncbi:MAG: ABC transporter ATP-binding protein [Alicyclobacillus shizuokensis]|nr:ABC transporter ATP-binding protein [Alicyclobacillus shizuokensis]
MSDKQPVLEVDDLCVTYPSEKGPVQAVSHVSFKLYPGEILGLVGESGSGKSTMAYAIMRLLRGGAAVTNGTIKVLGQDVYALDEEALRKFRWSKMSMVFQSAMNALNPVATIEEQILDTLRAHKPEMSRSQALERAVELFRLVRIDPARLKSYPHELSGGMRQRVVMAIAIALEPPFVIMDEPTTALDVVVQKSILDQIVEIQQKVGFSVLFISHDFSLVAELADRMAVMYAGRIVELTETSSLETLSGHHPYTEGLLKAIPQLTGDHVTLEGIPGSPPDLVTLPQGCAFHPRCPYAEGPCFEQRPKLVQVGHSEVECHFPEKVGGVLHGQ